MLGDFFSNSKKGTTESRNTDEFLVNLRVLSVIVVFLNLKNGNTKSSKKQVVNLGALCG